jgi:3-hydroxyisobutyrate dehydrogenase
MEKQRIGFIGLGAMGLPMACRLAESGHPLSVYNRTRSKTDEVAGLGARVAESPKDAAAQADVVMLSLADQHVVETMLFGADGVYGNLRPGGYIVDLSTVPPGFARELSAKAAKAGYKSLDACVLGNPRHAREGDMRVMVGGDEATFKEVENILQVLGKEVVHLGGPGLGATMKLVLNMLMGSQMQALAEAVVFGDRAGLPRDKVLEMIGASGYSSPVMKLRCGLMGRRAFHQAMFKLSLMRKDMMLVLDECQQLGVPVPVAETAYGMLTAAKARGLGDLDVSALLAFMETISGLDHYPWPLAPGAAGASGGRPGGPPEGRPGGPPEGRPGGPPEGVGGPPRGGRPPQGKP